MLSGAPLDVSVAACLCFFMSRSAFGRMLVRRGRIAVACGSWFVVGLALVSPRFFISLSRSRVSVVGRRSTDSERTEHSDKTTKIGGKLGARYAGVTRWMDYSNGQWGVVVELCWTPKEQRNFNRF